MDSFSSSVKSIDGYFHSLVFVDAATGYRWIYGLKTKDEALNVVKRWYADIVDLRAKHKLVILMRDNAGEYKSEEIVISVHQRSNSRMDQQKQQSTLL